MQTGEESDQHTSRNPKTSRDSNSSHEHYANDDVEMGILNNAASYPSQPPEAHRGSRGLVSLYMYDSELEDESMSRGFRHMRIEV